MINKQKLWFLTLFSLILVLSVYYITMPSELLTTAKTSDKEAVTEKKTSKTTAKAKVSSTDSLTALQVELDEERQALAAEYNEVLTNKDTSAEEKNNAYKTIKEQNEKILEADKVKNEFLANISHELRTPLNSILGFSDILSTQLYGNLNSKQEEYINDIKVSATHLLGMINEVLDMSKIEANAMKIVKSAFWISRAVNEVCNILKPLALKKNINLNLNMKVDFEVFADYQKIQQILYNLVSNAIKYSPENDNVEIKIEAFDEFYRISIHDNGIGIDKKYHGKIFAKFVQLDSAYTKKESSTGLGLTITKELVELHEGKISLISEVNNGSTFIVEIPF